MDSRKATAVLLCEAILETIKECPDGAPSGVVYAAMMTVGVTLDQYEQLISLLIRAGLIEQRNHVLYTRGETNDHQA